MTTHLLVCVPDPLLSRQCQKFFTAVLLRPGSSSLAIAARPAHGQQKQTHVQMLLTRHHKGHKPQRNPLMSRRPLLGKMTCCLCPLQTACLFVMSPLLLNSV